VIKERWNLKKEKNIYHTLLRKRGNYKSGNYSEEEEKTSSTKVFFHSRNKLQKCSLRNIQPSTDIYLQTVTDSDS
jgi:hypothetical protein